MAPFWRMQGTLGCSKTSVDHSSNRNVAMKHLRLAMLALFTVAAFAQPAPTARLRGSIEKVDATSIVIKERSGETMTLALPDNLAVNEVLPLDPGAIQSGKFVGTAAMPGADGTLAALEVLVFP